MYNFFEFLKSVFGRSTAEDSKQRDVHLEFTQRLTAEMPNVEAVTTTTKEPEFPVVPMDGSFFVQKAICTLGGCDFDFVGPYGTEQEAADKATEMENEGQTFNVRGACPECYAEYMGFCD